MDHYDNPYELSEGQRRELMNHLLFLYGTRTDLKRKRIPWEELPKKAPELSTYTPQVLRFYTRVCASFGMLNTFDDREEYFTVDGLSQTGKTRLKGPQSRMKTLILLYGGYRLARFFGDFLARQMFKM